MLAWKAVHFSEGAESDFVKFYILEVAGDLKRGESVSILSCGITNMGMGRWYLVLVGTRKSRLY